MSWIGAVLLKLADSVTTPDGPVVAKAKHLRAELQAGFDLLKMALDATEDEQKPEQPARKD